MGPTVTLKSEAEVGPQAPLTYTVSARTTEKGRAVAQTGHEAIAFDASWAQPPSGLPGPAELLASAFAACLLKNIERVSHLLSFRYENAEVDVTVRRQDAPPKFVDITYELRIATGESDQRLELLHRNLRQFGTVYNTLAAACAVHGRVLRLPAMHA